MSTRSRLGKGFVGFWKKVLKKRDSKKTKKKRGEEILESEVHSSLARMLKALMYFSKVNNSSMQTYLCFVWFIVKAIHIFLV